MNIKEIESVLKNTPIEDLLNTITQYESDERAGVQKLILQYQKKYKQHEAIVSEWKMRLAFDEVFEEHEVLIGVDEVG